MKTRELPDGFNCTTCETRHTFPAYVFAHWDDVLTHTCDKCGALHNMRRGFVDQVKAGKKVKA